MKQYATNWRGIAEFLNCQDLTDEELKSLPLDSMKFWIKVTEIRQAKKGVIVDQDSGDEA